MKKFLIGAVATAAIVTPCVAHADTNAIVGLNIGGGEVDTLDWDTVGIDGAFSHDFNNGTVMQFEAAADRVDIEDVDFSSNYAAVHYGVRSDSHAFGGFVSMEELFFFSPVRSQPPTFQEFGVQVRAQNGDSPVSLTTEHLVQQDCQ
jgi:hypothetical protein